MSYSAYVGKKLRTTVNKYKVIEHRPYTDYEGKILKPYVQPPKCECDKGKYSNYKKFNPKKASEKLRSDFTNLTLAMERIRESISNGIIGLLEDELMDSDFFKPLFQASVAGIQPGPPKIEIPDDKAIESDVQVLLPDFRAETSTLLDEEKVYVVGLKKNYELVVKLATDERIPESNALTFASIIHERLGEIFEQEDYSVLYKAYQAQNPDIANILSQRSLSVDDKQKLMDVMLVEAASTYEKHYGTPTKIIMREFEEKKKKYEDIIYASYIPDLELYDKSVLEYAKLILDFSSQKAKAQVTHYEELKKNNRSRKGRPPQLESRTKTFVQEYFSEVKKKNGIAATIMKTSTLANYLN
jgi:hypothetical protein